MITSSRTRIAVGAAAALLTVGGAIGAAAVAGAGSTQRVPPSTVDVVESVGHQALAEGETVDTEMVLGHDGKPVGFLADGHQMGDSQLKLGRSATQFRGVTVYDQRGGRGAVVGYLLTGDNGFVSVEQVHDPAELARIEQVWAQDQAALGGEIPAESRKQIDQYESQLNSN